MWRVWILILVSTSLAHSREPTLPERVPFGNLAASEQAHRDAIARFGAARIQHRRDDTIAAAKNLEAVLRLEPAAVAPRRALVAVYSDLGRDAAAIRMARQVLEADPHDADTAHRLAKLLFAVHRYTEAGDALAAAVSSPQLAERATKKLAMLIDLARCRELAKNFASAEEGWQAVRAFLRAEHDRLLREGFSEGEWHHEVATAAEKHGHAYLGLQQFDAATKAFLAARNLFADRAAAADEAGAARLNWNLAEVAAGQKDPSAAVRYLEAFLAHKPRDVRVYERYAEQLRLAGKDSVEKLRKLVADGWPEAAYWVMLAESCREPAGFGDAHSQFTVIATETIDPAFFQLLVRTYAAVDSGSGLLGIADSLFPNSANATNVQAKTVTSKEAARRQAFALALVSQPQFALKVTQAAQFSSGTRRSPELWDLLAWACERAGKPEAVESALRAALRGDLRQEGAFAAFRRLYAHLMSQRKWREVLDLCDLVQAPGQAGVMNFFRAAALAELGNDDAALRAISRAENDNAFAARREKIHIYDILGRHALMLAECDKAMAEFQTPAEIYSLRYLRAQAFLGLKRFDDAEAELRGIIEDDADDVLALNNLGYNLADQNRKLDEAEYLIRRAIEIDTDNRTRAGEPSPDHAPYLDSLGWVLFRKGQLEAAREYLERAVNLVDGHNDPTVWDHLGDVYFRLNNKPKAKEAWTKAVRLYATHFGNEQSRHDEVLQKLKLTE